MKIRNRLNPSDPCFSFEFFPPKSDEGVNNLLKTLAELAPLEPGFVSVTYGAGGSTRD
ncbi:MAG TPA: methylenetetrahydrofolate reductase, partial [Archangium sp.]|nr:methylenetetrahydrofolate reductase [Archangium sp.]